jgi:hypothetical protein
MSSGKSLLAKLKRYFDDWYYANTGRILGCRSKDHTFCKGEIWSCERCRKRVCWEEGSTEMPEICDDCWAEVNLMKGLQQNELDIAL